MCFLSKLLKSWDVENDKFHFSLGSWKVHFLVTIWNWTSGSSGWWLFIPSSDKENECSWETYNLLSSWPALKERVRLHFRNLSFSLSSWSLITFSSSLICIIVILKLRLLLPEGMQWIGMLILKQLEKLKRSSAISGVVSATYSLHLIFLFSCVDLFIFMQLWLQERVSIGARNHHSCKKLYCKYVCPFLFLFIFLSRHWEIFGLTYSSHLFFFFSWSAIKPHL